MNLLEDEVDKKQFSKGSSKKNKILILLIVAIILLVLALAFNSMLPEATPSLSLEINGQVANSSNLLYSYEEKTYISLEELAPLISYKYLKGAYKEYSEDEDKCYLEYDNLIIGFEADTNEIYKTYTDSSIEYQKFKLNNKILGVKSQTNTANKTVETSEKLYIALEDVGEACNIVCTYDETTNKITIKNAQYYMEEETKNFTETSNYKGFTDSLENKRSIAYGVVVVEDSSGKLGVLSTDLKTIKIGFKYASMEFDEYLQSFIISNNGKYGLISKEGKLSLELKYEDLSVISYEPIMYSAKIDGKYGVIDENGKVIVEANYTTIGYSSSSSKDENTTIIIKNLKNDEDGIVVGESGKYGIVNLSTGKLVGGVCELKAIYSKTDEEGYFIKVSDSTQEFKLQEYLDIKNTESVNIN